MSHRRVHRRVVLQMSAAGGLAAILGVPALAQSQSPNEKLNIAVIGCGNRGAQNIDGITGRKVQNLGGMAQENIVALCDVDDRQAAGSFRRFPKAAKFKDFRKMLETMEKQIDAVLVAAPDHIHAPASVMAMKMGKHCYCEKPLAHSVYEARVMAQIARQNKLATQMGNQVHACDNYRRIIELLRSDAIGPVRECYVWIKVGDPWHGVYTGKSVSRASDPRAILDRPKETPPVPPGLDWDLWLGPAPFRPYHGCYVPHDWHYWWDFSGGTLSNFGCQFMDCPFWALDLRHPTTIASEGEPLKPEGTPHNQIVHYEFPTRGKMPPVKLIWMNGPKIECPRPLEPALFAEWPNGYLFVGDKGMLLGDYNRRKLLPEREFKGFQPPPQTIPSSIGTPRGMAAGLQDRQADDERFRLRRRR